MEHVKDLTQAYSEAPWRRQVRIIVLILLFIVSIAIIAGIYLNITARAATFGREIQEMQIRFGGLQYLDSRNNEEPQALPIEELEQKIASLESELAYLTSFEEMESRARDLGFMHVDTEEILYLQVTGYSEQQPVVLASPPEQVITSAASYQPAFKQSLIEWVKEQIIDTVTLIREEQP
jgi:hypothetical protein